MEIYSGKIKDVVYIKPKKFVDERGCFQQIFHDGDYKLLSWSGVKQINKSYSKRNVLRGIHKVPFAKLVSCITGKIFDVVIDLRKDSPTYKQWDGYWLTHSSQLFVPANCGHAFFAVENSVVVYAQDDVYDPSVEETVNCASPSLDISWPAPKSSLWGLNIEYIMSEKDKLAPCLE